MRRFLCGLATALTTAVLAAPAAAAAPDIFTVTVHVDATEANAAAARDAARLAGERQAYTELLDELTLARDRSRLPAPSDTLLNEVIQGFEVANEQHSTVRYLADYSFHFRPDAVEQLLRSRGIPFAETASKPVVVLAILETPGHPLLWDDPNPWRSAWGAASLPPGLVPLTIPLGDIEDVSAIDGAAADRGDDARLQAISANYGHADVLVTRATIGSSGAAKSVSVSSTRFTPGSPGAEQSWVASYVANPGESDADLLARAVTGTAAQVEDAWKQANILDYSQSGTLVVTVPADDLRAWLAVRKRLGAIAAIQRTDLLSLDRHAAHVALHYVGSADQLRLALAQSNLDLSGTDPDWVLKTSGAAAPATPAQ